MSKSITVEIPQFGLTKINFFDISDLSYDLYLETNEFERQKNIPHLGIINKNINCAQHTRFDYLMLQLATVDLFEKINKGSLHYKTGELSFHGKKFNGASILKCWFMLSNYGHPQYTISDEQIIQELYLSRRGFRNYFNKIINDDDLIEICIDNVKKNNYMYFHHLLSWYRINKSSKTYKKKLLDVYKLLISKDYTGIKNVTKLNQLKDIFNIIRNISIIIIDSRFTHIPFSLDFFAYINSIDQSEILLTEKNNFTIIEDMLKSLNSDIYLNKKVIEYNEEYKLNRTEYLNKYEYNYSKYIKELFKPTQKIFSKNKMINFMRVEIPIKNIDDFDILKPLINIKKKLNKEEITTGINTFRYDNKIIFDFICKKEKSFSDFLKKAANYYYSTINQIENINNELFEQEKKRIDDDIDLFLPYVEYENKIEAIKDFYSKKYRVIHMNNQDFINNIVSQYIYNILTLIFPQKYYFDINDKDKRYYALKNNNENENAWGFLLDHFINNETDLDRKHEILHFKNYYKRKFDGIVIGYYHRITINDKTMPPEKSFATDLDSLIIKVSQEKLIIELFESKNCKDRRVQKAVKDINDKMKPIIRKGLKKAVSKDKKYGARLRIII